MSHELHLSQLRNLLYITYLLMAENTHPSLRCPATLCTYPFLHRFNRHPLSADAGYYYQ